MAQEGYFRVDPESNCIVFRPAKESATCYGVNLAFAAFDVPFSLQAVMLQAGSDKNRLGSDVPSHPLRIRPRKEWGYGCSSRGPAKRLGGDGAIPLCCANSAHQDGAPGFVFQ